jgi:hypothetical protein
MPLTTVLASKEGPYGPVLLCALTFPDGTFGYFSTHAFSGPEGGNTYQGNSYLARLSKQDIQAIQARSDQGIDRISDITLHFDNADQVILTQYEQPFGKGFKGTICVASLILMDIDLTGAYVFSTDTTAPQKFTGICDAPNGENGGQTLTVRATTSHNLAKVDLPPLHVQQRCINVFPRNATERLAAGTDISAWQYGCGYDPDQAGTDPEIGGGCRRGNTTTAGATDAQGRVIADGAGIFISCNYTKADCIARGMYFQDSGSRATGRFTAIQWAPLNSYQRSEQYTTGKWVNILSGRNDAIYQRSYPLLYGTQWVKQPIIANVIGDANSTRMEVVVCTGDIGPGGIIQVVVNGVLVPAKGNSGASALFRWNFLDQQVQASAHTGNRNGFANPDAGYDLLSDPYGSLATIEIVVFSELAQSASAPEVRILARGPKLATFTSPTPPPILAASNNPAWVLLDLLVWSNYSFAELDLQSFIDASHICNVTISYLDIHGNSATHGRFEADLAVENRQKANGIIQALLRSFNAQLVPNSDTGLLQLFIRQTLAEQQGGPIAGSNYNTSVQSITAAGVTSGTVGYVAYLIDESVIQQDGKGVPKIKGPYAVPSAQAPNVISFPFQDSANTYADDSISVSDADDIARAGGHLLGGSQNPAGYSVLGIQSFDQGIRCCNVILAEGLRGNWAGDTRGTFLWDVETTHRLEHIKVGQIVLFRYQAQQLQPPVQIQSPPGTPVTGILARVEAIRATTDYERMTLTLRWHEDGWYTDAYGQHAAPLYSDPGKYLPIRPPYPWMPFGEQPLAADALFKFSDFSFRVAQSYPPAANEGAIASLTIGGCAPVNQFSPTIHPPLLAQQGTTANSGGTIPGNQRIYFAISVQDSNALWSAISKFGLVDIPPGTNTNTVTTPAITWQGGEAAYTLFAGNSDQTLSEQATGASFPSTFTLTSLNVATYGPPDQVFSGMLVRVKRDIHAGVWGDAVSAVTANHLKFNAAWTVNQWAGRAISLVANDVSSDANVPLASFLVSANTADTLTVTPDPLSVPIPIVLGDVFVMRTLATTFSPTTIGDSQYVNFYAAAGLDVTGEEAGNIIRIIGGTGAGTTPRTVNSNTSTVFTVAPAFDVTPDATSIFIVEEPQWQTAVEADSILQSNIASPAPVVSADVSNFGRQTLLVQVLTQDQSGGKTGIEAFAPLREIFMFGAGGTRTVTADTTQLPTDGILKVDTTAGPVNVQLLPRSQVQNKELTVIKTSSDGNAVVVIWYAGPPQEQDGNGDITRSLTSNVPPNNFTVIRFQGA